MLESVVVGNGLFSRAAAIMGFISIGFVMMMSTILYKHIKERDPGTPCE